MMKAIIAKFVTIQSKKTTPITVLLRSNWRIFVNSFYLIVD
jgi:hypothetical protein